MSSEKQTVLITGAAGFIGQLLARHLLSHHPEYHLVLTDIISPPVPRRTPHPENATTIQADLCDAASLAHLLDAAGCSVPGRLAAVFILHGIMSSASEADPPFSQRVNLDATRALLLALAAARPGIRVVYASSQAVYGAPLPAIVTDATTPTPASVYGTHKLMTEVFLSDLHRRGQVDAFALRFPSVTVRPGKPSPAASAFLSGMVREPLAGQTCVVPLRDRTYQGVVSGPKTLVGNLVRVMKLPADALPPHIRSMNVPGIAVTVQDILDALVKVGGPGMMEFIKEEPDPEKERILRSWPVDVDCSTAMRLGLARDESMYQIVQEYWDSIHEKD